MTIARYYDEAKNPDGRFIAGVPLRDIEEDEFKALPEYLQRSVDAADIYKKTKPRTEPAKDGD